MDILAYWPIITAFVMVILAFGKFWQILDNLCVTVRGQGAEIKETKSDIAGIQLSMITIARCDGNRDRCGLDNAKEFNEIKSMLREMDTKRETSKENTSGVLSKISISIGQVQTKVDSLEKALEAEKQDRLRGLPMDNLKSIISSVLRSTPDGGMNIDTLR